MEESRLAGHSIHCDSYQRDAYKHDSCCCKNEIIVIIVILSFYAHHTMWELPFIAHHTLWELLSNLLLSKIIMLP